MIGTTWSSVYLIIGCITLLASGQSDILFFDEYAPIIAKTNDKFLSIGLDSSVIQNGFKKFNMSNPKLVKMIRHLAPAYLRVGGNMADCLIFKPYGDKMNDEAAQPIELDQQYYEFLDNFVDQNFSMSGKEWLMLNNLTKSTNLEMVFDLNVLRRLPNNSWDSRNAEVLFDFSNKYNLNLNWQLGNEPNAFRHKFNQEVNASQLAADFYKLRKILKKYNRYANSYLIGPDTTRPDIKNKESMRYLTEFLKIGKDAVDIISWHQYYFNGRTANASDFVDPSIFDILSWQIDTINQIQKNTNSQAKKVWLAETASAWGGGSPKYSDRFIASFIWLDKLGIAANKGIDVVVRQSIFNGYYALISDEIQPNPDYWVSILYKKFVGNQVLSCFNSTGNRVRLYCHCTKRQGESYQFSSVTVYGMNMQNVSAQIRIKGLNKELQTPLKIVSYTISSSGSLLGKNVYLNNNLLRLSPANELPPLHGIVVDANPYVVIPPFSMVFWIIPSKNKICYRD